MLYAVFGLTLFAFGGFHMWVKCLAGILIALGLLSVEMNGKQHISIKQYTPCILLFFVAITSFWSIDWTKNIEGILTALVLWGWFLFCQQIKAEDKDRLLGITPYLGVAMVAISVLALLIKNFPIQLWQAERLGGFFQYSNTCALFLGICIMIECGKITEENNGKKVSRVTGKSAGKRTGKIDINKLKSIITIIVLILGLLLTGSRGVLLLMFAWGIYKLVADKKHRKIFALGTAAAFGIVIIAAEIGRNSQNLGRLASILTSNSTIWGRILYVQDGLKMLLTHPFGMGYMGYHDIQGSMQTGVYSTAFVHNEILQMGLDYGIIAMIILVAYIVKQLVKGKQSRANKEYLVMILVASLMDFNLQYLAILMLIVLCLDMEMDLGIYDFILNKVKKLDSGKTGKSKNNKNGNTATIFICFGTAVFMGFWLIEYGAIAREDYVTAGKLFKSNTDVLEYNLMEAQTTEEAMAISDKLLKINEYSFTGWLYRAYACGQDGNYDEMIRCENKLMETDRYNVDCYKAYDSFISYLFEVNEDSNEEQIKNKLLEEQRVIPQKLKAVESVTSKLAYKIKDKPEFEYQK